MRACASTLCRLSLVRRRLYSHPTNLLPPPLPSTHPPQLDNVLLKSDLTHDLGFATKLADFGLTKMMNDQ